MMPFSKIVLGVTAALCVAWMVSSSTARPATHDLSAALSGVRALKSCPSVMRTMPGNRLVGSKADLNMKLSSPLSKCIQGNSKVSVCGNGLVVLRPSMSVHAEKSSVDADQLIENLSQKWDGLDNKGQVAVYAAGAMVALVAGNAVVTTIDGLPFLPYFTEVVGTCYSAWFAYKYLLFESSRKELIKDLDVLLSKVTGEVIGTKSTKSVVVDDE